MQRPKRVLSFISHWGGTPRDSPASSVPGSPTTATVPKYNADSEKIPDWKNPRDSQHFAEFAPPARSSTTPASSDNPPQRSVSNHSRRGSMLMTYQPPMMEMNGDTPPELTPVFTFLNNHATKLYQEGYFLKLHDLDSRGRPSADRVWNECFAQLVGTVLSLWDAAQLDVAGEDGEVVPTFINLTDASIKMIESLPMNGASGQNLQNVLSISTAANNRYLLHFNSLHSLTQWTAGIRLAMFEHASLQEAYTGSILAGKGRHLNNIRTIMERSRFPTEDWARVRFGAGTPWRRCWCVIAPADEKQIAKAQKDAKKRSAYDKARLIVKGEIRFYETRKVTKKTRPIATITDAHAAYAIYPQSKALIDSSTLVKVEGTIKIHSQPESSIDGFVFVMPEVHAAITGFEMMLRWLLPTYDTFALYGRPERLVATALDVRSLMFAMPSGKRYGYLDLIDVSGLIHTEGSQNWSEKEWKKQMKNLTSKRMTHGPASVDRSDSAMSKRDGSRASLNLPSTPYKPANGAKQAVRFGSGSVSPSRSSGPESGRASPSPGFPRTDAAPQAVANVNLQNHSRSVSDTRHFDRNPQEKIDPNTGEKLYQIDDEPVSDRSSPDFESSTPAAGYVDYPGNTAHNQLQPVAAPPALTHSPASKPALRPNVRAELQQANSTIDAATLDQLVDASRVSNSSGNGNQHYQPYLGSEGPPPPVHRSVSPNTQAGPPPSQFNQTRGPPPPNHTTLATIPGTPSHEINQFDLPIHDSNRSNSVSPERQQYIQKHIGAGSITRKPVRTPANDQGY